MTHTPLLYLNGSDLERALPMPDAIDAMREAFLGMRAGHVTMPARGRMDTADPPGTILLMPCHDRGSGRLSIKTVALFPGNAARGLPMLHALLTLADAKTGAPLAIMDGAALTAIRTAAVSGLATRFLAVEGASTLAVFGAGVQARSHLAAIRAVRPIREIRVFDTDAEAAARWVEEIQAGGEITARAAANPAEALAQADVVCTVSTSDVAVFDDPDVAAGAHINAVGSYKPDVVEVPAATVRRALVVVDQREAAMEEAGDLLSAIRQGLIASDHIRAELGELLTGDAAGREHEDQVTLFKSVGLAVEDLYAAVRAVENARRKGLGIELPR